MSGHGSQGEGMDDGFGVRLPSRENTKKKRGQTTAGREVQEVFFSLRFTCVWIPEKGRRGERNVVAVEKKTVQGREEKQKRKRKEIW